MKRILAPFLIAIALSIAFLAFHAAGDIQPATCGANNYSTVQDEAISLTPRPTLNMTGAGVTCADNSGALRTDCTIPGGGGGPTPSRGTFAGLPSCTTTGQTYFFTNSFYQVAECASSTWAYFATAGMLTPPVAANFGTTVGTPTNTTTFGGVQISAAAHSGDLIQAICKNLPAAPYTIDLGLTTVSQPVNYLPVGLALYDGTKFALIGFWDDGGFGVKTAKFTNTTTFSAYYANNQLYGPVGPMLFMRIADNSTNRIFSYSNDNSIWQQVTSVGNTDFLTPTQVCMFADSNNTTYAATAWMLHYLEH